jgi:hypothetical protein
MVTTRSQKFEKTLNNTFPEGAKEWYVFSRQWFFDHIQIVDKLYSSYFISLDGIISSELYQKKSIVAVTQQVKVGFLACVALATNLVASLLPLLWFHRLAAAMGFLNSVVTAFATQATDRWPKGQQRVDFAISPSRPA